MAELSVSSVRDFEGTVTVTVVVPEKVILGTQFHLDVDRRLVAKADKPDATITDKVWGLAVLIENWEHPRA